MKNKLLTFSQYALEPFIVLNVIFYGFKFLEYFFWAMDRNSPNRDLVYSVMEASEFFHLALVFLFLLLAPLWFVFAYINARAGKSKTAFAYTLIAVMVVVLFWRNYLPFEIFMRFYELFNGSIHRGIGYYSMPLPFAIVAAGILSSMFLGWKIKDSKLFINASVSVSNVFRKTSKFVLASHVFVAFYLMMLLLSPTYLTSNTNRLLSEISGIFGPLLPLMFLLVLALFLLALGLMIRGRIKYRFYLRKSWFGLLILDIIFFGYAALWTMARLIAQF